MSSLVFWIIYAFRCTYHHDTSIFINLIYVHYDTSHSRLQILLNPIFKENSNPNHKSRVIDGWAKWTYVLSKYSSILSNYSISMIPYQEVLGDWLLGQIVLQVQISDHHTWLLSRIIKSGSKAKNLWFMAPSPSMIVFRIKIDALAILNALLNHSSCMGLMLWGRIN